MPDAKATKAKTVALLAKQHIEHLKGGQEDHEVHCIAVERLVELHPTFRRSIHEAVPSRVFEGSAGVRTTIVCPPESVRLSLRVVKAVRTLGQRHYDLLVQLKDDVVVLLLNVEGIEVVVHQIGYAILLI
jgi:hypothetical protein